MGERAVSDTLSVDSAVEADGQAGYESLVQVGEDGLCEVSVLVDGIYCAACIQAIETSLHKQDGIKRARLNFSTRRLSIVWDGGAALANDYVRIIEGLGYGVQPFDVDAEKDDAALEARFLLLCLGVAGFAMGNVMMLSVGVWASSVETMGEGTRGLMHWISALIALPTILFSGRPFFRSALSAVMAGRTNMDVPISVALILAGGMSLHETITHGEHVYFDSAVMLMFFLLVGRYLDFRARRAARSTATDLLSAFSGFANVVEDGQVRRVVIRDVREGMRVRVNAGDRFPVDGIVVEARSDVDTSLVTGETLARSVEMGAEVYAGTVNISAPVLVEVVRAAEGSLLADIVKLMEKAGQGQARYVRLADRAARLYTPVVHVVALAAFIGWWAFGGAAWQEALMVAITVLIITCPCALGLAVPVVQVLASGRLMKAGVFVKAGDALERLARVDVVLLDKTGTLTVGRPELLGEYDAGVMRLAASLAAHSSHVLARAMVGAYDGALLDIDDVREISGQGIEGVYDGQRVRLGRRSWCGGQNAGASDGTEMWLESHGNDTICFFFEDRLREDANEVVRQFERAGVEPIIVSGDRREPVEAAAAQCGVARYHYELKPADKYAALERMQGEGRRVLMIGDGLNDAPVLAGADVSMAPGSGIDVAQNAADIVFMGERLAPAKEAHRVAVMTQRLVAQNFVLAIAYNMVAIPLAVCGFVTPLVAALAMSGSSLIVIANSFRLRFSA